MKSMFKILSFAAILAVAASPAARADNLGGPGVYFGTGNPDGNFIVASDGTVQLGLKAITRGVAPPIVPSGIDYSYTPGHGSNAALSLWNFNFSVNTGAAPLNAYTYLITVTDVTNPNSHTFNPDPTGIGDDALANSAGPICNGNGGSCTGLYNPATEDGFQNSENLGFGFLPGFNPNAYDKYTITLTATSVATGAVVTDSINVVPAPEPSSLVFLGTGLMGGIGTMLRRRRIA